MRKKKYVNRNTQTKAMKPSVTDLQEIVKAALKEAMSEEDCKGEEGDEAGMENAADIIEAASDSVNKSRKEGEGIAEEDAVDLLNAVTESERKSR
ncbi:MAG: hypothetical protein ACLVAW_17760 [Eisenbergiella massiliensis]